MAQSAAFDTYMNLPLHALFTTQRTLTVLVFVLQWLLHLH
jgi:hypothetical protein